LACAPAAEMFETTEKDAMTEVLREVCGRRPCQPLSVCDGMPRFYSGY
jgi:hypothetical protein